MAAHVLFSRSSLSRHSGCFHLLAIASDAAVNSCEWDFVRACVVRSRAHHGGFLVTVFSCECWTTFFAFLPQECKQECELAIADLQSSREEEAGLQQSQVTWQGPHRLAVWSVLSPQGTVGIQMGGGGRCHLLSLPCLFPRSVWGAISRAGGGDTGGCQGSGGLVRCRPRE